MVHGGIRGVCTLGFANNLADITQANVLVDHLGRAHITDFSLAAANQNQCLTCSVAKTHDPTMRWIAPEVLDETGSLTKKADVFSFAMVMIEVSHGPHDITTSPTRLLFQ